MIISEPRHYINQWIGARNGGYLDTNSFTALACVQNQNLIGALTFYEANKKNCWVNIALKDKIFPPSLLNSGLTYVFHQLALKRLTFRIPSVNLPSQTLVRRLGAIHEATLRDADDFGDALMFALFPESCPFWSRLNVKRVKRAAEQLEPA